MLFTLLNSFAVFYRFFLNILSHIPDDDQSEIFCHDPLTGNIMKSEATSGGEFQQQMLFKAEFCPVGGTVKLKILSLYDMCLMGEIYLLL